MPSAAESFVVLTDLIWGSGSLWMASSLGLRVLLRARTALGRFAQGRRVQSRVALVRPI